MAEQTIGILGCSCCCCIFLALLLGFSLQTVDQTESCVKYDWWLEQVSDHVYTTPGLVWVGMGNYLVCYPNTNQYVYFRKTTEVASQYSADVFRDPMGVRSSDGLSIQLELEFVYKPQVDKVKEIYMLVGDEGYQHVLVSIANGILNNEATLYTASQFFDDRAGVQLKFTEKLRQHLNESLFMDVTTLQLQPAHFPVAYEQSILNTQVMTQDIQVARQEQQTTRVKKTTELFQAQKLAERALIQAEAQASNINWTNSAEVSMFQYRQLRDAEGFKKSLEWFGEHGAGVTDFLEYLNALAMQSHNQASMTLKVPAVSR